VQVTGRVPLPPAATPENLWYLTVKRDRLGHFIDGLPAMPAAAEASGLAGAR